MSEWDSDLMDDLEDDLEDGDLDDDLDDDLEDDMSLEDGGDEVSADSDDLSDDELSADYAISDRGIQALSADRGAALDQPKLLGDVISGELEKKLAGGSKIVRISVHFANGRKLHITP
jgi:hypothetical protein